MRVADIMTPSCTGIEPDATIAEAIQLMLDRHISGLPVVGADGHLAGIVTESDFMRRIELGTQEKHGGLLAFLRNPGRDAAEYVHAASRRVGDVMTHQVVTIEADAPVEQLAALMAQHGVHRVPVVEKGRLVGIAARSDLMRAVLGQLTAGSGAGGDQAIRQDIMAALNRQPWLRNTSLRLKVADGVVELSGLVYHDSQRHAARVIAENVAGVKRVDDRLGLIDPLSGCYVPRDPLAPDAL